MRHSIHPSTRARALLLALLVLAGTLVFSAGAGARPNVAAARSAHCGISSVYHKLGATYVETLSVENTSCGAGENLVRAYNRCRVSHGGVRGHCTSAVSGYRCREMRETGADQFVAAVTCTRSRDLVKFSYSQNF